MARAVSSSSSEVTKMAEMKTLMDTALLQKIKGYIQTNQPEFTSKFLDVIDVNNLDADSRLNLLLTLLSVAVRATASSLMLEVIIGKWTGSDAGNFEVVLADLAAIVYFQPKCLTYILTTMEAISIESILKEAIDLNPEEEDHTEPRFMMAFSIIANRVIAGCKRSLKMEELERLMAVAVNRKRMEAIGYLKACMQEHEVASAKPEWLHYDAKIHTTEAIQHCQQYFRSLDSTNTEACLTAFKHRVDSVVRFDLDKPILLTGEKKKDEEAKQVEAAAPTEEEKEAETESEDAKPEPTYQEDIITPDMVIHDYFAMASTLERHRCVYQRECEHLKAYLNPDMVYGPMNSIADVECVSSLPGGCRMLTCLCRNGNDADEDEESVAYSSSPEKIWFSGYCDACSRKIGHWSWALRFPVNGGGWVGTYCSLDCIFAAPPRPLYRIDTYRLQLLREHLRDVGTLDHSQLQTTA